MTDSLPYLCSAVVAFGLVFAWWYPGGELLRIRRYAAQLRDRLDSVALTLDVKTSVRNDERGTVISYTFSDGNYVSLLVGDGGFNVFTPAWNPGFEKNTDGLAILLAAIEAERVSAR